MKSVLRLCCACVLVVASRSTAWAVTTEECNSGPPTCSQVQTQQAQACTQSCQWQCAGYSIHINYYLPGGCYADPTQSYCVYDGYCECECDYV
jgi:hypothetical protein